MNTYKKVGTLENSSKHDYKEHSLDSKTVLLKSLLGQTRKLIKNKLLKEKIITGK